MSSQFDTSADYDYTFTFPDDSLMMFFSGIGETYKYQRGLTQVLREQVDSNPEPGNSSLAGWWLRTQVDWSAGAGLRVQEPVPDDETPRLRQYLSSSNVDTMEKPGEIRMVPSFDADNVIAAQGGTEFEHPITSDVNATYVGTRSVVACQPLEGHHPGYYCGSENNIVTGLCVAGETLVAFSTEGIFTAPAYTPGDENVDMTQRYTNPSGEPIIGAYIKQRVIASQGPNLYELTDLAKLTDASVQVDWPEVLSVADLTPWYTNPDSSYKYTGVTETPRSILVAGYGTTSSEIFAITLDTDGTLPTTEVPVSITLLPPNEFITDVRTYLGSFIAISTTRGIRVGGIDADGYVTYGPLLDAPRARTRFSFYDRFVIYGGMIDGTPYVIRVDLSEIDGTGRAAWSTVFDVSYSKRWKPGSDLFGIAVQSDENLAVYYQDTSGWVFSDRPMVGTTPDPGWLEMPLVRYGTLEKKQFLNVTVTKVSTAGNVKVLLRVTDGSLVELGTVADGQVEATFSIDELPQVEAAVRLEFTATDDRLVAVDSVQLRALAAPEDRAEYVVMPMLNYDFEKAGNGATIGYEGRAIERYKVFRDAVRSSAIIQVTEPHDGLAYDAIVTEMVYEQREPPTLQSGFGGVMVITLRTV